MLFTLILVIHVLVCLVLIATILVQQGKGATMGAAFGTAGSQTVFGSAGAGNFLTKTTSICAAIFFSTSLLLAYRSSFRRSVVADVAPVTDTAPAAPADGSAPKPDAKPDGKGDTAPAAPAGSAPAAPKAAAPAAPPSGAPATK
jgi:preprotein translocase subunit SecG